MSSSTKKPLIKPKHIDEAIETQWFDWEQKNGEYYGWMNMIISLKSDKNS